MGTLDGASMARGARRLLQAPGAVPDSGADTGPLDSGSGLEQRASAPSLRGRLSQGHTPCFPRPYQGECHAARH